MSTCLPHYEEEIEVLVTPPILGETKEGKAFAPEV